MAIYRGKGGKTDVVPADGDQEFAGSIIAEKDIHAHGNISADGSITANGDISINGGVTLDGSITGDGSGLYNVPTPFLIAEDCIYLNGQEITGDHSIPAGKNGMSAGDVTISALGSVFVPEGSTWTNVSEEDGVTTLESLGIPNHDLMNVDLLGGVTATSFKGDGSQLTGLSSPELYDLGLDNHELITVDPLGGVTVKNLKTEEHIEFPDGSKQTTVPYTKEEVDAQQDAQDTEIDTKLDDAPDNGIQYVRQSGVWAELAAADGGIADAPENGKLYGRKDYKWEEIVDFDGYTKSQIDSQQAAQDELINGNNDSIIELDEKFDAKNVLQDAEIAKKADKDTTYTKDEVDDIVEKSSGAIVADYTNKWANSVARDPGVGNLYLVLGMEMSSSYGSVTKIYISDTDGDGEVRNFSKVDVDDQIEITSEKGSGKYTIVSISDVGGYRELVVSTNKASGTVANDTPVSIVMDVASAGGTGGVSTVADGCIYLNNQTIENDYTIPEGMNGMSAGAIEFKGTVTVPDGSKYHVVDSTKPKVVNLSANRNFIINGDMKIAQRGTDAVSGPADFPVDRFRITSNKADKFTAQQSTDVPAGQGFVNSIKLTSSSAYTEAEAEYFLLQHRVEGNNIDQLYFGTDNAKTVTLSFWAKSSLTGTFAGALRDGGSYSSSYIYEYNISSADTWEYKTVTITGPTSGTWLSGVNVGAELSWALGGGSGFDGTAGAWQSTSDFMTPSSNRLVGTSGATLYITGVQLEIGEEATPFEHVPYDVELARCQRYYYKLYDIGIATNGRMIGMAFAWTPTTVRTFVTFPVTMRDLPLVESSNFTKAYNAMFSGIARYLPKLDIAFDGAQSTVGCLVSGVLTEALSDAGLAGYIRFDSNSGAILAFNAEL